jgi:bifunctional lysine-specific demethylase and histidyl-hydroxylase MINA
MTRDEAKALVEAVLAPAPLDRFLGAVAAHRPFFVRGGPNHARRGLLGADPKTAVLAAHATHVERLDWHATAPSGPPPPRVADSAHAFEALVADFHARGYTVRVPDAHRLTAELARLARAIEAVFGVPVGGSVFWSADRARAKVHHDDNDILVVQLVGTKRWWVSTEPPLLPNPWKDVTLPPTELGGHSVIDLAPGDLLYVARGTAHTVESDGVCLHVSLTFTPPTLRSALCAALDLAAGGDRTLRTTALSPDPEMVAQTFEALARLVREPGYLDDARALDRSRFAGALPALDKPAAVPPLTTATRVRHTPLALLDVRANGDRLDLAMPGGHLNIHAGAKEALRWIADTPEFAVGDVPGLAPDVATALVDRLVAAGVLEVSPEEAR